MAFSGVLFPATSATVDGTFRGITVIGLAFVIFFSALIAAVGPLVPTPVAVPAHRTWREHYAILLLSLVITGAAAGAYTLVHFTANP